MDASDRELLRVYAQQGSEEAFAALAQRHLDLVYWTALRQVRSPQLAEEVAQSVFADLARRADQMKPDCILTAWLYRVTRCAAIDVVRGESRRRRREQAASRLAETEPPETAWAAVEPLLDEALERLGQTDRSAILLRYFANKSLREVGEELRISEDAAQKRVSRAIESLRQFFSRRGVAIGSAGLVALLSTQAASAAPAGLGAAIAAGLSGATASSAGALGAGTIGFTKTIVMTTTQKLVVAAVVAASIGTGVYQCHRASRSESESRSQRQQLGTMNQQVQQLAQERDEASNTLAGAQQQIEQLRRDSAELPKLRAEVARLREEARQLAQAKANHPPASQNPQMEAALSSWAARAAELWQKLEQAPDKRIPEVQLCDGYDWLEAAKNTQMQTDTGVRQALGRLRQLGKEKFGALMEGALDKFTQANNGQLPTNTLQLKAFCDTPVDDAIFARYKLLHTGKLSDLPPGTTWLMTEKAPVDQDYDSRIKIGVGTYAVVPSGPGEVDEEGKPAYPAGGTGGQEN